MRLDRHLTNHLRAVTFAGPRATVAGTMEPTVSVLVNCRTCGVTAAREFGVPGVPANALEYVRAAWDVTVAAWRSVRMCAAQNGQEGCVHFGLADQARVVAMTVGCWAEWVARADSPARIDKRASAEVAP